MLNLPVQASVNQTECLINLHKQARQSRKDQPWRRLATVNKIAQVKGWNLPTYREPRNLETLLKLFGEYSHLTGKRLGIYYLSTLDLDLRKEEFPEKLTKRLEKNTACLLDFLKTSYDQTKKGFHIDILTPEPLSNGTIYWTDKLSKKWVIGSIQSKGKYVVGEDPNKSFIKNGKWYWKTPNKTVKETLSKFFFELKEAEQQKFIESNQEPKTPLSPLFSNLNIQKPKHTIQAKILSKQKIPITDIWKVFYLNWKTKQTGYFLWNDYHRQKINLTSENIHRIILVKERKHFFFSCFI